MESAILTLRGQKVVLDADLARVYGVTTKALNQAVKRNADRFPEDFAFVLTDVEKTEVVTNCDHLSRLRFSPVLPNTFTEHGAIPPPDQPKKQIGFGVQERRTRYVVRRKGR